MCVSAGNPCPKAPHDQIHALDVDAAKSGNIALIGFVAGGVLLGTGITLVVLGKPKPTAAATVTPWLTGSMGGLQGTF